MRYRASLLLLIIVLAVWQPHLSIANTNAITTEVTLYAHTDLSAASVGGRVLSLVGNATSRQFADMRDALDFTLVPSLSAPLRLVGRIDVYVWLVAQQSVRGTLRVGILEIKGNASATEIRSMSVTITAPSNPYQVIFGLGAANHTLAAGSTLKLEFQFSPVRPIPVLLLWDDPAVSTRIVLEVESIPRIDLRTMDSSGRASTVFPENSTGHVSLLVETSVEDPFHGTNVQMASLTITNSSGFHFMSDTPMNLTSRVESPFRLGFTLPIELPSGKFNITTSVRDLIGRVFVTALEITVTRFYRLVVIVVDLEKKPVSGTNVSLSASGKLIDEITTNSTGMATSHTPSSRILGPLTVQVQQKGMIVLSRQIHLESDSVLQLEVPLSDWDIVVRLQTLNLPVSGAKVELYLNGTFISSAPTDGSGFARFTSVPLGRYEIAVASSLASKTFSNVTHSRDFKDTVLELPALYGIPDSALIALAFILVISSLAVITVRGRRTRPRHFKHIGELLGGAIPHRVVMMIVGPSGSGKSVLLQNILVDSLGLGRRCVCVSNAELPSKIKGRLTRMGINVDLSETENRLRFVDAYSGGVGTVSSEKHSVSSPSDLTALGIQMTSCLEELGGTADIFLDSLAPIVAASGSGRGLEFVQYYGARTTKAGGTLAYVATTNIESEMLGRLEEASDCVLEVERSVAPSRMRGRVLVKKARGLEHVREWVGFSITSKGRMDFWSLPTEET